MQDEDLRTRIGEIIKEARIEKDMSQGFLANLTGLSQPTLSKLERGISLPDMISWIKISIVLEISQSQLESTHELLKFKKEYQKIKAKFSLP